MEIREKYGIDRRSAIQGEVEELKVNLEVLVNAEDVFVTLSKEGYVKRTGMQSFTRSGGERNGSGVKEGDYISQVLEVNTLENLLVFTQKASTFAACSPGAGIQVERPWNGHCQCHPVSEG